MSKLTLKQSKYIYDIVKARLVMGWDDLSNAEKMDLINMQEQNNLIDNVNKYIDDLKFKIMSNSLNHVNK